MDSWSLDELKAMQTSGNRKRCQYLSSNEVDKNWPIKSIYESAQVQRYKQMRHSNFISLFFVIDEIQTGRNS